MIVGKAIYYLLTNATDVTDVVSTRIYPEVAQQDSDLPFIVYNVTNNEPTDTKPEPSKLDTAQVEVNLYAESYTEAIDLAVAVRAALDRVKGTYNGVNVQSIQYQNEVIDFDEPQRAYNISADYDVRISRSGFEIAQGSPITGVQLGELSDVDVTGVTNGQLIAYNDVTGNWEAADDAGGAETLDDLTDVDAGAPSAGQLLAYGQDTWETIAQDELTLPIGSVTGLQAALDAAPDNLRELTDVTISNLADNDYLQYDSATGVWENSSLILGRNGEQYTGNYDSEAETLLDGATDTVELYYTAQADGDGLHEDAQTDTAQSGFDIQRKLYYAEKAQADPNTSGDWTQFTAIADNTTFANAKAALLAYLKERTGGTVPISLKMTWEEVAQAPAFTGLLNESYGSGAEAAYSTRRLNGNVTDCMVIRRASDSTTQTIGFDGSGNIDESAIEMFCTGTTCTVVTWKDQSGNGNDATAPSTGAEPTIYTGGALVKENGKLMLGAASGDAIMNVSTTLTNSNLDVFSVNKSNGTGAFLSTDPNDLLWISQNANTDPHTVRMGTPSYYFNGTSFTGTTRGDLYAQINNTQTLMAALDIDVSDAVKTQFGWSEISGYPMYQTQEIILFSSDKSSVRTSIESNIGDYFTQNTPLLDTYSGAAAAYSLRLLDSTYTGSAVEVYNGSSYADIGFNVFGELDTVALAAHCGSNDGFVSKWYDQSGNSNTAAQTTTANMPKIYDGTTGVVTENGKPAVEFDGSNDKLQIASNISAASNYAITWVQKRTTASGWLFDAATGRFIISNGSNNLYYDGAWKGTAQTSTTHNVNFLSLVSPSSGNYYENGTNTQSGLSYSQIAIGGTTAIGGHNSVTPSNQIDGTLQEFIIFAGDQSSNRTNIEDNMNTFYSIY